MFSNEIECVNIKIKRDKKRKRKLLFSLHKKNNSFFKVERGAHSKIFDKKTKKQKKRLFLFFESYNT